jgi:hypothetical protein
MKTPRKSHPVVHCTFHGLAEMTPAQRHDLALWLRRTGTFIKSQGKNCAPRTTFRHFWT